MISSCNVDESLKLKDLFNYSTFVENIKENDKIKGFYPYLDATNRHKCTEFLLKSNKILFEEMLKDEIIDDEILSTMNISFEMVCTIFDLNLRRYYSCIMSRFNESEFEKMCIDKTVKRENYEKLIFDMNGDFVGNKMSPQSICKVCCLEIYNKGALEKVFNNCVDEILIDPCWKEFIELFKDNYGGIEKKSKYFKKDEFTEIVYKRFLELLIIKKSSGISSKRLYFKC